jgi:UDP-N-acetyl-D-glucosamine/UDP-N-acetyl-D-galactosamine dehydrogenase
VSQSRKIAVIGLGYVGLPVAVAFARSGAPAIGFDINRKRIGDLHAGINITRQVESSELAQATLVYESDPAALTAADFYIVTAPTPIDDVRMSDLGAILSASEIVGAVLNRGDIIAYEATVYPGCGRRGLCAGFGEACPCMPISMSRRKVASSMPRVAH